MFHAPESGFLLSSGNEIEFFNFTYPRSIVGSQFDGLQRIVGSNLEVSLDKVEWLPEIENVNFGDGIDQITHRIWMRPLNTRSFQGRAFLKVEPMETTN